MRLLLNELDIKTLSFVCRNGDFMGKNKDLIDMKSLFLAAA